MERGRGKVSPVNKGEREGGGKGGKGGGRGGKAREIKKGGGRREC